MCVGIALPLPLFTDFTPLCCRTRKRRWGRRKTGVISIAVQRTWAARANRRRLRLLLLRGLLQQKMLGW